MAGSIPLSQTGTPLSTTPVYNKDGKQIGVRNSSGVSTNFIQSMDPYMFSGGGSGGSGNDPYNYTPQQQEIFDLMQNFATTGTYGNLFTAGESYGGELGNYDLSENELLARERLNEMMQGGLPESFQLAQNEVAELLGGSYDPYNEQGVYSGFKAGVEREAQEQSDALNRRNSITGDLYATEGVEQQGLLAERTHQTLSNKLAELYETYTGQRIQGISLAGNLGISEENINMGRLNLANEFGQTDRSLLDTKAQREHAEWVRQRGEYNDTINVARDLLDQRIGGGIAAGTQVSGGSGGSGNVSASAGVQQPNWNDEASVREYQAEVSRRDNIARERQSYINKLYSDLGKSGISFNQKLKASSFQGDLFSKGSKGAFEAWAKEMMRQNLRKKQGKYSGYKAYNKSQVAPSASVMQQAMKWDSAFAGYGLSI